MNVITWNRAISLFPKDTFIDHRTIISRSAYIGASTAWRQKYIERGFEIVQEYDTQIQTGRRQFSDAKSWVIDFKISGKTQEDTIIIKRKSYTQALSDIDLGSIDYTSPNEGLEFQVESTAHILNCALKLTESVQRVLFTSKSSNLPQTDFPFRVQPYSPPATPANQANEADETDEDEDEMDWEEYDSDDDNDTNLS